MLGTQISVMNCHCNILEPTFLCENVSCKISTCTLILVKSVSPEANNNKPFAKPFVVKGGVHCRPRTSLKGDFEHPFINALKFAFSQLLFLPCTLWLYECWLRAVREGRYESPSIGFRLSYLLICGYYLPV